MVTVVHAYNRFHSSEIRCFVNGKVVSTGETTLVHANEVMMQQTYFLNSIIFVFQEGLIESCLELKILTLEWEMHRVMVLLILGKYHRLSLSWYLHYDWSV